MRFIIEICLTFILVITTHSALSFRISEHGTSYERLNIFREIQASCGTENSNVYSFTIPASSPRGPITLFHIQYDSSNSMPVTSTAFHDSMNLEQLVEREDNFKIWDCPQLPVPEIQADCTKTFKMTADQAEVSGYTSYDRGHLSPVNPYRFDFTAMDNTFYCVNNAPQEPYTNQVPWNILEQTVLKSIPGGLVITGTCSSKADEGPTLDKVEVPDCYFKLVCYLDGSSTEVVGFIGENSLFDRYDTSAETLRKETTFIPKSQSEVKSRTGRSDLIENAWRKGYENLLGNRESNLAPNAESCVGKLTMSNGIKEQWEKFIEENDWTKDK